MNIIDVGLKYGSNCSYGNIPKMLIVHHIEAEGNNWTVQNIHNMHKNENGWAAIGYHYYIRLDGSVYRGRPDNMIGSHCQGCNTNTLGIAFEGNYDKRTSMPVEQMNSWIALKQYLFSKYGTMPVYGHKEKGSSECPGKYFPLKEVKNCNAVENKKHYVVTDYLPGAYDGYNGVDINYILSYFKDVKTYVRGNEKGVWIETQYLPLEKCNQLKEILGSWFYAIKTE